MRKTRILQDAGSTLADHARELLGGGKPGLGGWLKTGAALGAARTGARVATRFAKRNPGIAVAATVAAGAADTGFGIEAAAARYGLDFVPLITEHYYLACLKQTLDHPAVRSLIDVLKSDAWRTAAAALPGYYLGRPGAVVSLTKELPWYRYRSPKKAPVRIDEPS